MYMCFLACTCTCWRGCMHVSEPTVSILCHVPQLCHLGRYFPHNYSLIGQYRALSFVLDYQWHKRGVHSVILRILITYRLIRLVCGDDIPSKNVSVSGRTRNVCSKGRELRFNTSAILSWASDHSTWWVWFISNARAAPCSNGWSQIWLDSSSVWKLIDTVWNLCKIQLQDWCHFSAAPRYGD